MTATVRHRLVPHTERATSAPGPVLLHAEHDHRLKVHASAPVVCACKQQRVIYTRGDIDVLPAGMSTRWDEEEASTAVVVRLPHALLRRAAEDLGHSPEQIELDARWQLRDPQIEHIAWALDAERAAGDPNGLLYAESLGTALAVRLLAHFAPRPLPAGGLSRVQLRRVTEHIDAHLDRSLSLEHLAEVAGLGATQLKLRFRRSTGRSVHAFVIDRRIERARQLLRAGALSISQVALEVGFAHGSHLARCMRRALGVSPRDLLREHHGAALRSNADARLDLQR
ncbi:MAG: helix-turn-helix transcriptional regulator [Deltaproteobacteria bacterium]|nr:helix-turn-helix transcriptional regulator [Nannocystaceae bacterium]